MGAIGSIIATTLKRTLGYSDGLYKDIKAGDAARFARPGGQLVVSNHPSFVLGHLCLYPSRCLELTGHPGHASYVYPGFDELFKPGVECKDDASGAVYPAYAELLQRYKSAHGALLEALPAVADEVMGRPNPNEANRERFPTVGALVSFLATGHMMMHLGQVSAWRRMMGMPAAG
ncbi:MAG: hypothetical protein C0475_05475 [Planctomyces sp.]|nr:hypothetical protein [Planctomyces sp.]MBA4039165.1 hypothetical protein [Planctomyces sp.]MBA4119306.1 hypothetical protein [Isosphaera sp.]